MKNATLPRTPTDRFGLACGHLRRSLGELRLALQHSEITTESP